MVFSLNPVYKLLNFNSLLLSIFFSILLQVIVFGLVSYFGYLYFLLMEVWMFLIILFFKPVKVDYSFFIFIFYILTFTSFLISILFLSESCEIFIVLLFIFIIFKVLFFSVMLFIFQDNEFIVFNKHILVIYIFNFKLFLLLFVLLILSDGYCFSILLMFFLDFIYLFLIFWIIFFIIMIKVLLSGSTERYLFTLLNFSHYILFLSCFLSVKLFLYCSFLDCLVCFLVSYFIHLRHNNFTNSFLISYTSLFLFLFTCHSYGVPPFPSFLLEVCLMFLFVNSLGQFFGYFFILLFYIVTSLNFIFIFLVIGKINNNIFVYSLLSDKCFLILVLFLGIFISCFFNVYIAFII